MATDKSESNKLSDKLSSITTSLHEVLECPVCLAVASAPLKMCSNGHVTCSPCASKMSRCSLCREVFLNLNPTCLNNLLTVLPKFCKFADDGCKEVFVAGDDHETFCGHRSVSCLVLDCQDKVKVRELKSHYEVKHPNVPIRTQRSNTLYWKNFDKDQDSKKFAKLCLDDCFFLIYFQNDTKANHVRIIFIAFPVMKLEEKYFLTVRFENGEVVNCKTIKSVEVVSDYDTHNLNSILDSNNIREDFYMTLTHSLVHHFVNDDGTLKVPYTVIKMEA